MNFFSNPKIYSLGVLFVMLIIFTFMGFRAMRKGAGKKEINLFWLCIAIFFVSLALYLGFFFSPLYAIAPVLPLCIFIKLFLATRDSSKK